MAIKINFDVAHNPEEPTLVLAKKNGDKLGKINAKSIEMSDNMNDASEITFNVYKYVDGEKDILWDFITNFKLVYCVEWDCWFEATVEIDESNETIKTVFCTQLGHAELGQIMLYNIAINTDGDDGDIARDDYVIPTVLYRKDEYDITESDKAFYKKVFKKDLEVPFADYKDASLLHRILKDKAPHYSVKHVDNTIAHMQRVFDFDDTSIYDALQEIAEEINCLFVFDAGIDDDGIFRRTISAYDLESNCNSCNYRGEFFDICPECGSDDINDGYGEDTTIFVTADEIAEDIQLTTDVDAVKNCFKLEAGDELMTATIKNCNPNGSDYIWYLSDDMKSDMSDELVEKIDKYNELYRQYQANEIKIDDSLLSEYNDIVDKYNYLMNRQDDDELEKIESPVVGFPALIDAYYNTFDMLLYLESGLMPTVDTTRPSIDDEIAKLVKTTTNDSGMIVSESLSPVAVNVASASKNPLKASSVSTVDNLVLSVAKSIIDSRYKVKIEDNSVLGFYVVDENGNSEYVIDNQENKDKYEDGMLKYWRGNISLTAYSDDETTKSTNDDDYSYYIEVEVNDDYETFIRRKLDKALTLDDVEDMDISGLFKKNMVEDLIETTPILTEELFDADGNRAYTYNAEVVDILPEIANLGDMYMCEGNIYVWCEGEFKEGESFEDSFEYALKQYSLNRLKSFQDACQTCLELMQEMNVPSGESWGKDLYEVLYMPYFNKLAAIEAEIAVRDSEIAVITGIKDEDGNLVSDGLQTVIENIKFKIQDSLNFEKFLGEALWIEFCSFRREDKYSNDNFISDGKNNAELISLANEFIEVANKDIFKSAELQCSISSELKNLLVIEKFEPLVKHFKTGNWLRVMIDDNVYKLRLIKYDIDYGNLDSLSVEFADTVRANSSIKSVKEALEQASSMATSYSAVQRQASQGEKSNDVIKDWFNSGLDATNVKIVGGADGQAQSWDKHGMLFREYDESAEDYTPEQMKIINSTLAITTDNWETTKTAVGKYYYQDRDTNEIKMAYGINAETIVGKLILGQNIDLRNEAGTMTFDDNGLVVQNDSHIISINPNDNSIFNIGKKAEENNESILSFDENGNLNIKGKLTAANKNDIKIETDDGEEKSLHDIAISGSYVDLSDKPKYGDLEGTPTLHKVAISGDYEELENKPDLFSGSYNDLSDKPEIPTVPSTATSVTSTGTNPVSGKAVYNYAVAKNQGATNAGKLLYVNDEGSVTTLSIEKLKELLGI